MSMNKVSKILISAIIFLAPCVSVADCCCRKIVDYMVVVEDKIGTIQDKVNRLIKEGWQPLGGISSSYRSSDEQAMVKYENVEGG
jgi:hypothetical protein